MSEEVQIIPTESVGRVRTSGDRREELLAEYDRSGMTGAAFCRWVGVKYPTFMSWLSKRREAEAGAASRPEGGEPMQWLEAVMEEPTTECRPHRSSGCAESLRIEFGCGARMEIGSASQAALAAAVLRELERSSRRC